MLSKASKCQGMPVKRVSAINNCNEGQGYSSGVGFCILYKALGLKVRNCTHTNRTSIRVARLRCNLKQDPTALTAVSILFPHLITTTTLFFPALQSQYVSVHPTRFLIRYHTMSKLWPFHDRAPPLPIPRWPSNTHRAQDICLLCSCDKHPVWSFSKKRSLAPKSPVHFPVGMEVFAWIPVSPFWPHCSQTDPNLSTMRPGFRSSGFSANAAASQGLLP